MNAPQRADSLPPSKKDDVLARLAKAQLGREGELLEANLEGLRQVWAALRGNDPQALEAVLGRQVEQEQHREGIRQERHHFQQQAAAALGVAPEAVHLGLVVRNLRGESANSLEQHLQCLRDKIQEAEQLRDNVASLIGHCLSFLNRFLLDLTGAADGGRYGPAGARPETASGLLLELRG